MTDTSALVDFLLARLDEDEAQARDAIAERDRVQFVEPPEVPDLSLTSWPDSPVPAVLVGPERVLADVAAKRAIVQQAVGIAEVARLTDAEDVGGEAILGALASVYADHPDYRAEWATS